MYDIHNKWYQLAKSTRNLLYDIKKTNNCMRMWNRRDILALRFHVPNAQ